MGKPSLRDPALQAAAVLLVALLFVFGWMTRYEPVPFEQGRAPWILDRWTGQLCTVGTGELVCFGRGGE